MKNKIIKLFALVLGLSCIVSASDTRPNILLIISDDQSWTDYGFMGHPYIETPNLDRLADESALFRRGYVPTALCRPALTTLATGLYAHDSLITGNDPADTPVNREYEKKAGESARELLIANVDKNPTVARLLSAAGYLTLQTGKWWEGSYHRGGFTHGMTRGYPEKGGRHGDDGLDIGREGIDVIDQFVDTAVEADKPFFIWYAPFMPHTPHTPPERILKKYTRWGMTLPMAKYFAMCDWFDESCGQVLGMLERKGVAEETLVIYVTDNGWIQDPDANGYAIRSKRSPYEGGIRTPIMFKWPGIISPQDRPELCSSIDIVPTILAAAGIDEPSDLPGLNLLPMLKSEKPIKRSAIYGESFAHDIADIRNPEASLLFKWVIKEDMKLLLTYDGRPGRMKYPPTDSEPQLFNLIQDPEERVNLAGKYPQKVDELSRLLDLWYPLSERVQGVAPATGEKLNVIRE